MNLRLLCILLLAFHFASAQNFGGFPSRTKWRQLNSDTARIIFTPGSEYTASRVYALLHRAAADTPMAIGTRVRKINVVLHSRTTLANGYVALGPFRSEFYLIPGSSVYDFGNLPWADNLALHEYRHVQQYNNFRNGLSKAMSVLFGQGGQALANALSVPDWFFEGDAVHTETALTPSGRGRLSYFMSGYRSLWLEKKNYGWMKLRNGSLKDYVPNHYQLGYLFTNYGYARYGNAFWKNVTQYASAFKGLFYPFQRAVRRHAGVDYKTFRKEAFDWYKGKTSNVLRIETKPERTVTSYYFPQFLNADSILYLKRAYDRIATFMVRDSRGERSVKRQAISNEEWFAQRQGTVAYTAYSTHPRWSLVDYSDIVLLDLATRKEQRITKKERFFTPDISPSGNRIVSVRVNDSLQTELVVLSRRGEEQAKLAGHRDRYFFNPRFINEEDVVVSVRHADSRMSMERVNLFSGRSEVLIPAGYRTVSLPFVQGDTVLFTGNIYGNDDVFALSLQTKELFQLTRRFTGTYFPSAWKDSLAFSFFTSHGLALQTGDLRKATWARVQPDSLATLPYLYPVAGAVPGFVQPAGEKGGNPMPYAKTTGLLNFHTWRPDVADPEYTISVFSDNILNTFSNQVYYRYNRNEGSHAVGWNAIYGGWFPQIIGGVEYTGNRQGRTRTGQVFNFRQIETSLGYTIPLNLTRGRSYKLMEFGSDIVNNSRHVTGPQRALVSLRDQLYLRHDLSWAQYRPRAVQHIFPKLGYTFYAGYRHRLQADPGAQLLVNSQVFLPSLRNHSLVLAGSYQDVDSLTIFSDRFAQARGFSDLYYPRAWRLSANYHFPILYPDAGVANIAYLLRLRGNLFFDYSRVFDIRKQPIRDLRSTGAEVYFDTKWWNQLPVSFGFRVSYLLTDGVSSLDRKGNTYFEFIVPIGLIPN